MEKNLRLLSPSQFKDNYFPNLGRSAIYDLVKQGRLKSIRVGRKILIPVEEASDFIKREAGIINAGSSNS